MVTFLGIVFGFFIVFVAIASKVDVAREATKARDPAANARRQRRRTPKERVWYGPEVTLCISRIDRNCRVSVVRYLHKNFGDVDLQRANEIVDLVAAGKKVKLPGLPSDGAQMVLEDLGELGVEVSISEEGSATSERLRRKPVPERVRHEVWRRDQGGCVDCGSRERLEFDHIVPISRGGANTARNLELRCESCNRTKGARI